ncbi:MAG: hypothetical protein KAT43_02160 [Nanoarchaeota archaeon]|nr:hypothetical protein [Nanoarchaeota archaeon]
MATGQREETQEQIGEGSYRRVYRVGDIAFKDLKPYVEKRLFGFRINIPISLYTSYKLLIRDYNLFEFQNYKDIISQIPEGLRDSFAKIFVVAPKTNGKGSLSLCELVCDANGEISKTMWEHGRIPNPEFWNRLDELEELFLRKGLYFLDPSPMNILVKEHADERKTPVFVDYKKTPKTYPFRLRLRVRSFVQKRVRRKFNQLREQFHPDYASANL